jgi:hypothetical protein
VSIADKLAYLADTKELIRQAINAKGGGLTPEEAFRAYTAAISELKGGGGPSGEGGLSDEAEASVYAPQDRSIVKMRDEAEAETVLYSPQKWTIVGVRDEAEAETVLYSPPRSTVGMRDEVEASIYETVVCVADEVFSLNETIIGAIET